MGLRCPKNLANKNTMKHMYILYLIKIIMMTLDMFSKNMMEHRENISWSMMAALIMMEFRRDFSAA